MTAARRSSTDDPTVITSIHRGTLDEWARRTLADPTASADSAELARVARDTCARIGAANSAERDRLVRLLADHRITVSASSIGTQRHTVTLDIAESTADEAGAVVVADGYRPDHQWMRGAARSAHRNAGHLRFTRTDDETTAVTLRWRTPPARPMGRALRPRPADWDLVELPSPMWWAYRLVRPVRLVGERIGVLPRDHAALEPYLVTPASLIEPLLDIADVDRHDTVLDFGCGDGRIVIDAARTRGCRAIGVEQHRPTAELARAAARRAGLGDSVEITSGDAIEQRLDDVTVVVMFLPMVIARRTLPGLLRRLRTGARVILHEQSPLWADAPDPDRSSALLTPAAVTVAHRWNVGAPGKSEQDEKVEGG